MKALAILAVAALAVVHEAPARAQTELSESSVGLRDTYWKPISLGKIGEGSNSVTVTGADGKAIVSVSVLGGKDPQPSPKRVLVAPRGLKPGAWAPDLFITMEDGTEIALSEFIKARKAVLISFFPIGWGASSLPTPAPKSEEELESRFFQLVSDWHKHYAGKGLVVLGIGSGLPSRKLSGIGVRQGFDYVMRERMGTTVPKMTKEGRYSGGISVSTDLYGVHYFPSFILIDPHGRIVWRQIGLPVGDRPAALEPGLEKAVASARPPDKQALAWLDAARIEPPRPVVQQQPGKPMPDFTLQTPAAESFSLYKFIEEKKPKAVLIDFWATWCGPCIASTPMLVDLYARYKDKGLEIIGVTVHDTVEKVQSYLAEKGVKYPVVMDEALNDWGRTAVAYKASSLPTFILIDAKGNLLWKKGSFSNAALDRPQFEAFIQKALTPPPPLSN